MKKSLYSIFILLFTVVTLFAGQQTNIVYALSEVEYPAKAYLLMDYNTGEILSSYKEQEKYQVASIVKLMTTLLALEALEEGTITLDDSIRASEHSASMGGSQAFLDAGQNYTFGDLLKSVIVASANDSSVLIAEVIGGSEENFVTMMNKRAKEIGLENTLYANASGLPEANQYSTAKDSAMLLKEVLKHKKYFDYSTIWLDELTHPLNDRKTELANTNRLIRYYEGCDSGKTGYTDEAGFCLVASAKKGNMRLIGVTLGAQKSKERFEIVSSLLTHGFSHYKNEHILVAGQELEGKMPLRGAIEESTPLVYEEDFYHITKKGGEADFQIKLDLPALLRAPLKEGEQVGVAYVVKDNEVIGQVAIVVKEEVKEQSILDILQKISKSWRATK